jgi:hypothetical protein
MSASNYLEDKILNATLVNGQSYAAGNVYAALYSVAPTESTAGTELTGSNYSRQQVTFSVSSGVASSTANVTFGAASADWSTAVAWAITDAVSTGNILYYSTLSPTQTVLNGDSLTFESGDITITIN